MEGGKFHESGLIVSGLAPRRRDLDTGNRQQENPRSLSNPYLDPCQHRERRHLSQNPARFPIFAARRAPRRSRTNETCWHHTRIGALAECKRGRTRPLSLPPPSVLRRRRVRRAQAQGELGMRMESRWHRTQNLRHAQGGQQTDRQRVQWRRRERPAASGQPGTSALVAPFFGFGSLTDSSRVICTLAHGGGRRTTRSRLLPPT